MRILICLLLISFSFLSACRISSSKKIEGNGVQAAQSHSITNFDGVELSGPMKMTLTQGDGYSVRIEADQNLMEYIEVEREGDVLHIGTRDRVNLRPKSGIRIFITAPRFDKIHVSGSGNISSAGLISSKDEINTDVSGSGNITLELDAPEIKASISGSGNMALKGRTEKLLADISGSGEIHAYNLLSERTEVDVAGSGDAEVYASKELKVDIAGSGNVSYRGKPTVDMHKAGSGSVNRVE